MKSFQILAPVLTILAITSTSSPTLAEDLRPVTSFDTIAAEAERSAALFVEAGKVLTHPRCMNCHPAGDVPTQGEEGLAHQPPVRRGTDNMGTVGMRCNSCHMSENFDPGRVPGDSHWSLAPRQMAWEGLTLGEICAQIKDPMRNGGRDLAATVKHMAEDALVGWAWEPGADRQPAPGSWRAFSELIRAWADTGAVCPEDSAG